MVISKEIKVNFHLPVTNEQVEAVFKEKGLSVLRWAITEADGDLFTIRVAVEV